MSFNLEIILLINLALVAIAFVVHISLNRLGKIQRWFGFLLYIGLNVSLAIGLSAELRFLIHILTLTWGLKIQRLFGYEKKLGIINYFIFIAILPNTNPSLLSNRHDTGKTGFKILFFGILKHGLVLAFLAGSIYISTSPLSIAIFVTAAFLFQLIASTDVMVGLFRICGYQINQIFVNPFISTSLSEFWGKRWNLAIHEFIKTQIFDTFKRFTGPLQCTFLAFFFSGLIHELILSVPVNSYYGFPTAYFLIQWVGIIIERHFISFFRKNKFMGWMWTVLIVILPLPLFVNPCLLNSSIIPFHKVLLGVVS